MLEELWCLTRASFLLLFPSTLLTLLILLLFSLCVFHSLFGLLRLFIHEIGRLTCEIFELCISLVSIEILGIILCLLSFLFHLFFCFLTSFLNALPIHVLEAIGPLTIILLRRLRAIVLFCSIILWLLAFWVLFACT